MEAIDGSFCHHLSKTGNHEGCILDRLGNDIKRCAFDIFQRSLDDARTGYADMDGSIALRDAVEGACHERIVFDCIAEFDKLRASVCILILCDFSCFLHNLAHALHSIHIDACLGGSDGNRAADALRDSQSFRNGIDQNFIRRRHASVYKCGKSAQNVDTDNISCFLECFSDRHIALCIRAAGNERYRRDRNTAVDDRHTVFPGNIMADFRQVFCLLADRIIDPGQQGLFIVGYAAQERNAHGNRADIQLILVKHALRRKNFLYIEHGSPFQILCMA